MDFNDIIQINARKGLNSNKGVSGGLAMISNVNVNVNVCI